MVVRNRVKVDANKVRIAAETLLVAAGLAPEKARDVAFILIEAEMMGYDTHGLVLLSRYIDEIENARMRKDGSPITLSDSGSCISWDGQQLPGQWLMLRAVETALERISECGTVSVAIGNSQHVGCLTAYLKPIVECNLVAIIASSAPGVATVAPFNGRTPVISPAPIAFGCPTPAGPILIDVSASMATNGMVRRLGREGHLFPEDVLLDSKGRLSRDPNELSKGGSILPVGGLEHGQKGYAWALISEALSQGLSGAGRDRASSGMINSVFLQIIDPKVFAGIETFLSQTDALATACRRSEPVNPNKPVRVPGERAMAAWAQATIDGISLYPGVVDDLRACAAKLKVPLPKCFH